MERLLDETFTTRAGFDVYVLRLCFDRRGHLSFCVSESGKKGRGVVVIVAAGLIYG